MSPKPRYKRGDDEGLAGQGLGLAKGKSQLVSAALAKAQEMARLRIAGELHDSISQSLGALAMGVEMTGGRFRLTSVSGCGTTITACWPLFSNMAPIQ